MDGFELCKKLKSDEHFNPIPLILLTARLGEENRIISYELGADAYIPKPFSIKVLKARIDNLISSRARLISQFKGESELLLEDVTSNRSDKVFLTKAIKIVEENLENPELSYREFTRGLGIGKTSLYNRIGQLTGQSINIFIRTIRLKKAAQLLLHQNATIAEISYQVGFSDPNYFSKCFKQFFDLTPSEYIEQKIPKAAISK